MITFACKGFERDAMHTELCIVGAGAAGLDMARLFDGTELSVVVIEGGGLDFDAGAQRLHRIISVGKDIATSDRLMPDLPPAYRHETRIRQFGGTSNAWSGKWKPHAPDDFQRKDWMPRSGWPLTYHDLLPFYVHVARDYEIPRLLFDRNRLRRGGLREQAEDFHYDQIPPLNFNTEVRAALERSKNVTVILNANAVELVIDKGAGGNEPDTIGHVVAKTLSGHCGRVYAKAFVLATGGFENARLLLNSRTRDNVALGNRSDLVGRFFMDHPKGIWGRFTPGLNVQLEEQLALEHRNTHISRYFAFSEEFRREHRLPNHSTAFYPVRGTTVRASDDSDPARRKPDGGHLIKPLPRRVYNRLMGPFKRSRPKPPEQVPYYELVHFLEQAPDAESRVCLSAAAKDELNEPVLVVDWKLSEFDLASLEKYLRLLRDVLENHHIGEISYPADTGDLRFALSGAHHHMGTTRMAASSAQGVVDVNCKVFGVTNLYVIGSSVFPTGGNANPTFTILALTRRLCHHLRSVFDRSRRPVRGQR
ncbi:MAG TPA: GMC family oxidoreductase [bacterium]|nr:GMC family oxidoreductase [bacterium]